MIRALGVFLLSATLASMFVFSDLELGLAQTQTPVRGIIKQDTTWTIEGSPYVFTGAVGVAEGVTLTVEAGVTVEVGSYYLEVNGTLNAQGTPQQKIVFNSYLYGSNIQLAYDNPTCKLTNVVLNRTSIHAASSLSNAAVSITNSAIIDSTVSVWGRTTISDSYFTGAVQLRGASIVSGSILLDGLDVAGSCIGSQFTGTYTISGNNITTQQNGIVLNAGASGVIKDNVIWGGRVGISQADGFQTMSATIENNLIIDNDAGIFTLTQNDDSTIKGNTISGNHVGLSNPSSQQTMIENNFQNNSQYNIQAGISAADAASNWWGTTDQAAISQSIYDSNDDFSLGTVIFTPFLTAADSNAPQTPDDIMLPSVTVSPTDGVTYQSVSNNGQTALNGLEIGAATAVVIAMLLVAIIAVKVHRRHR